MKGNASYHSSYVGTSVPTSLDGIPRERWNALCQPGSKGDERATPAGSTHARVVIGFGGTVRHVTAFLMELPPYTRALRVTSSDEKGAKCVAHLLLHATQRSPRAFCRALSLLVERQADRRARAIRIGVPHAEVSVQFQFLHDNPYLRLG